MFNESLIQPGARARAWRDSLFVDHGIFHTVWDNWAEFVPGKLYRSNHPTPGRLKRAVERHGITTLINLRGHRQCGSDALSREAAQRLGPKHIDMAFESRGAPQKDASSASPRSTPTSTAPPSCTANPAPKEPASPSSSCSKEHH